MNIFKRNSAIFFSLLIFASCTKNDPAPTNPPGPPNPPPGSPAAPIINSFTPVNAYAGDTVRITGANFSGATVVSFGGINVASFIVVDSTKITAVIGTGATGNVSVTTAYGSGILAGFTFLVRPNNPVYLLTNWRGENQTGTRNLSFKYDTNKKLASFSNSTPQEGLVYYKNDTISHIVFQQTDFTGINRSSIVFSYDVNKRLKKVYYKLPVYNQPATASYFSDTTDNALSRYDSLIYSSTGQLTEVWDKNNISQSAFLFVVKLQYTDLQKLTPFKMQYFNLPATTPQSELTITADTADNPVYKVAWFLPFVKNQVVNTLSFVIPSLTPEYSAVDVLPGYLCLVKKCVKNYTYKVLGTSSPYTFNSSNYTNTYTDGFFTFKSQLDQPYDPSLPYVMYNFEYR